MSYADGWPHLYSVPLAGGQAVLLTPGQFMVEHARLTPDRRFIVYSANTGTDRLDTDRRHIFKVPVDRGIACSAHDRRVGGVDARRHERWPVRGRARRRRAAIAAADGRAACRRSASPTGCRSRAVRFPAAQLVTPQQALFKSSDGSKFTDSVQDGGWAREASRRRLRSRRTAAADAARLALHGLLRERLRDEPIPRQPRLHRALGQLSSGNRVRLCVPSPENAGARGASEYLDVLAGGQYLQSRPDVDTSRIGIWGGSYGGYLTALALGRNSDIFSAGVDIHGVHNWDRQRRGSPNLSAALAGDGITIDDLRRAARVVYESSPISSVKTWKSPVLLIHADDDRNVDFHQTVDLEAAAARAGRRGRRLVIPDDIHAFLLFHSWETVSNAVVNYLERMLNPRTGRGFSPGWPAALKRRPTGSPRFDRLMRWWAARQGPWRAAVRRAAATARQRRPPLHPSRGPTDRRGR